MQAAIGALVMAAAGTCVAAELLVPSQYATIQAAIDAASTGDRVRVAPGVYEGSITFRGKAIVVRAEGGPSVTTIRKSTSDGGGVPGGNPSSPVVMFENGETRESVLEGFTITGGTGRFSSLWPCNCDGYQLGGGAFIVGASPTILNCRFVQNNCFTYFSRGGGAYIDGSPLIEGCVFEDNNAGGGYGLGGGIYVAGGSPVIVNVRVARCISNSYHFGRAGGIHVAGGAPSFRYVSVIGCVASHGASSVETNSSTALSDVHVSGARLPAHEGAYRNEGGNSLAGDCNGNGLDDGDDIATGRSVDLNADRVPDSCQTPGVWVIQPVDQTTRLSRNLVLVATMNVPASYRWLRNGQPVLDSARVSGAASGRLVINSLEEVHAGSYECEATYNGQSVRTQAANVRLCGEFTSHPSDLVARTATTVTMSVGFSLSGVTHQWRKDGVPIAESSRIVGATGSTLTIVGLLSRDQGAYDCVVTDACGSQASRAAVLSCRPVFTLQPVGGDRRTGERVVIESQVSSGGITTYRWQRNGIALSDGGAFSGTDTPRLVIEGVETHHVGSYSLRVTNPCNTSTSVVAQLTVRCTADFNEDGGADGQDLFDFFDAWINGEATADVNGDGGTDGGDVPAFFTRWERGC